MPLTSAEKSKRYREKLKQTDPERYRQMLKTSSERGMKRYREKITNLNDEQKKKLRTRWRDSKRHSDQLHNLIQIKSENSQEDPSHNATIKMPLTSAEKSKRYREKLKQTDPERYRQMVKTSSERGMKRYREKMANLNDEQRKELRTRWRDSKRHSDQLHNLTLSENSQDDPSLNERSQNVTSANATSNKLTERNIQRLVERSIKFDNARLRKSVLLLTKKVDNQQRQLTQMNEKLDILMKNLITGNESKYIKEEETDPLTD